MNKISMYQLFAITFIFQLGTTIIFGFGGSAGRDAWIGQLVSCFLGVFLVLVYIALMKKNPGLTFVQWFPAQLGRWLGMPLAFLYPLMSLYVVGRIIADIRDMVSTTVLTKTPLLVITGVFVFIIAYSVYGGIELVSRLGEMFLPVILIMFIIEVILLSGSGAVRINNILPVLEHGWEPVWKVVYPAGITQSFGETIVLAMLWPETKHPEKVMKVTILATIMSGLMLTCLDVMAILIFGGMFSSFLYPLYTVLGLISIGNFIENLQMFGVLYFLMTALLKSVVHMFAAVRGFQQLTRMKNYRVLIIPGSAITLVLGMTMSQNISEHIYRHHFEILVPYIWVPLLLVLPILLLLVTWLRQMKQ
ncbi:spore germination protein KB [Paenibacillus phyllosphaerae]|uniref:Spore germination protein KB n=1 Tax=Paenibacillus phyllosphaerae TaxID=274593 RepID=A0A7W5FRM1_9BACL|nr:endospore germination permease [Paenibacillus phyllosphaerae]MBB3114462.1 spore germination protein KB [Paenibacillus phyllosphaerae]